MTVPLLMIVGYLIGSIPFGYIAGKIHGIDLRTIGSHSTGGTNVYRALGLRWALASGLADLAKGVVFLMIVDAATDLPRAYLFLLSVSPILGHIFPLWLGFKGGKGVSVSFGVLAYLFGPYITVIVGVLWVLAVKTYKVMSLINIVLFGLLPILTFLRYRSIPETIASCLITLIIWWAHRENIHRLLHGTEKKLTI